MRGSMDDSWGRPMDGELKARLNGIPDDVNAPESPSPDPDPDPDPGCPPAFIPVASVHPIKLHNTFLLLLFFYY